MLRLGTSLSGAARAHHCRICPRWWHRHRRAQTVPGFEARSWYGIGAPKNTPAEIVDRLNKEINAALADPKMLARLSELGASPIAGSPTDFGKLIAEETEKWGKVVKFSGAKAD